MERKNVVFLSIVAVATLLTAVVGATFAYYTMTVRGNGNTTNNQSSVTTVKLAGITYEGNSVFAPATDEAYPGLKGVQTFTITPTGDATAIGKYQIVLDSNIDESFANDVTYKLYKTTKPSENKIERVKGTVQQSGTSTGASQFSVNDELTTTGTPEEVASGTLTTEADKILETISFNGDDAATTYYLTIEYANTDSDQSASMGKTFDAKITVELLAPEA